MNRYYFLGIGGIGMSAIARYFHSKGHAVAGYDKVRSQLCIELEQEGIEIHYEDLGENIDDRFSNPNTTLVIYTPAIPTEHRELNFFQRNGFRVLKRSEILGEITKQARGLCVAGTHGKTTTSTMIAHLLKQSHIDCNAFLGGISLNYSSNLLLSTQSDLVAIEADEYDRSFHRLSPYMAVITSTDADHLDIYNTHESYIEAFEFFTSLIVEGGCLIHKKGIFLNPKVKESVKTFTYAVGEVADFYAENIRIGEGKLLFDFRSKQYNISDLELGVPIFVNVENAVAAIAVAILNGVTEEEIRSALASYRGIRRRFEQHLKEPKVFIDDYAHHPEELQASVKSLKLLYSDKKVLGVFQPHLYSRTKDFYKEFADALSGLDEVVLVEIYPAREEPIEGVTSKMIFDEIKNQNKSLTTKQKLIDLLKTKDFDVLVTLGAGDIDTYIPQIKQWLMTK